MKTKKENNLQKSQEVKTTHEILIDVFSSDDVLANQSLFDRAMRNNDLTQKWIKVND